MGAVIGVIGTGAPDDDLERIAEQVGEGVARAGGTVVCGGLGGVMEAACRGAQQAGGLTVGLLPGADREDGNPHLTVALPTGLGEGRNVLLVRAADVLIAIGGGFGTLSEIGFALKTGKPVVGVDTWELARRGHPVEGVVAVATAADAVELAVELALGAGSRDV
jgi:uncharacterized protein (TIGR00725 family)